MSQHSLLRRIARLPFRHLLLLFEAACWLCLARTALRFVSFPRIARHIGKLQSPSSTAPDFSLADAVTARKIARAVNATAVNSPVEMVCLPRALAAWQMLHLRNVSSRLHFGKPLHRDAQGGERQTHAWLSSAGVEVTGYPVAHGCVEVGYFSRT